MNPSSRGSCLINPGFQQKSFSFIQDENLKKPLLSKANRSSGQVQTGLSSWLYSTLSQEIKCLSLCLHRIKGLGDELSVEFPRGCNWSMLQGDGWGQQTVTPALTNLKKTDAHSQIRILKHSYNDLFTTQQTQVYKNVLITCVMII